MTSTVMQTGPLLMLMTTLDKTDPPKAKYPDTAAGTYIKNKTERQRDIEKERAENKNPGFTRARHG